MSLASTPVDRRAAREWLRDRHIPIRQAAEWAGMSQSSLDRMLYPKATGARSLTYRVWWRIVAHAVLADVQLAIVDATAQEVPREDGEAWGTVPDGGNTAPESDRVATPGC